MNYWLNPRLERGERLVVLLLIITGLAACSPSGSAERSMPRPLAFEFRVVFDKERCAPECEAVELESVRLGRVVLWVRNRPDAILQREDVVSIVPMKLSGFDADRPESIVWTAAFKLKPEAMARIRGLASGLAPEDRILISADSHPLDVIYSRSVGQMMGIGEFSSRAELKEILGGYAEVEEGTGEEVVVFSAEELEAKRQRSQLLERSEKLIAETEKVQKLAEEGKISHAEMIERLTELTRELPTK